MVVDIYLTVVKDDCQVTSRGPICWEDTINVVLKSLRCIPRLKATSELMVELTFCHHSLDY